MASRSPVTRSLTLLTTALATLSLVTAACAATEPTDSDVPVGFPTIAPTDVAGVYEITDVVVPASGPEPLPLAAVPTAELDVVTGSLDIATACNRHLGSFTLDGDGRASFTVTGGTQDSCSTELAAQDETLLGVVAETSTWTSTDGNLIFSGDGGSMTWVRP